MTFFPSNVLGIAISHAELVAVPVVGRALAIYGTILPGEHGLNIVYRTIWWVMFSLAMTTAENQKAPAG